MEISRTLAAVAALFMGGMLAAAAEDTRPNILFIISDDHSVNALGTNEKDSPVPLPGFRRLADEGMVFDRAYCANSLCGPSRACMLTGRHSHITVSCIITEDRLSMVHNRRIRKCCRQPVIRRAL